jgi:hypothetical protein
MNGDVVFTMTVLDNVTRHVDDMSKAEERLTQSTMKATASTNQSTAASTAQNVQWLKNMASVTFLSAGVNQLTSSMSILGLVSKEDEKVMRQLGASVSMVVGIYQLFKGVASIVNVLRSSEVALAAVETYRSIINSKGATLALVGVGLGAAGAVAGYALTQGGGAAAAAPTTNVTQNIRFEQGASSDSRAMSRDLLDIMGG